MNAIRWIDAKLDGIAMYRLTLYYLILLVSVAVILSALGIIQFSPLHILLSASFLTAICWLSNKIFAYVFEVPTNPESALITALILSLIISPTLDTGGIVFLAAAGGLAMASKYLISIKRRHIFNPAAIAVALTAFGAGDSASWWVGTASMLPVVLAGGVLLARRIRRTKMIAWFILTATLSTIVIKLVSGGYPIANTTQLWLNSAMFFFAFVMLTEPMTSPTTKANRRWYAVLTGLLFPPQIHLAGIYSTPELVLMIGNIFATIVGPRTKVLLRFKRRINLSHDSAEFVFKPEQRFAFQPGQYMEFTFAHRGTDSRGARRYFTIASSPTEPEIHLGVKFYKPGSSFKRALSDISPSSTMVAGQLGGDFTLPKNPSKKLVFIAGGIGITPYRSMVKYLIDTMQSRPITLLYSANTAEDLVYRDIFDQATDLCGLQTHYVVSSGRATTPVTQGRIDQDFIVKTVPDYKERTFYISGPHGMVVAISDTLRGLGVPADRIKKDFFSGYA